MTESTKTITFAAVAAALVGISTMTHFANKPTNSADFELVGQPFFEKFESAEQAQSLEVVAVDAESVKTKRFAVENKDGLWRIPSHYNYPAEAAARLATTASSVIGINRDSMAGRMEQEHARFGVVDPLSEDIDDPESVGKRITMKDSDGDTLVDYIIGKEAGEVQLNGVEEPFGTQNTNEKYYYVRRPDEQQTYKVKLDIDLSAKFSDWIDPDLLRLDRNQLIRIKVDNYTLEEDRTTRDALFKAQGDQLHITRKTIMDPWALAELNTEIEDLNTAKVDEIIGVLDELKISGVRPKYKYKNHLLLTSDLQLNSQPEFKENPREFSLAIGRLQSELGQKGFSLAGSAEKMELVSQNGELELGTDKGMVYTLHIGEALEGNEEEIEVGLAKSSDEKTDTKKQESDSESAEEVKGDDSESADQTPNAEVEEETDPLADAKNRYLMVRVSFDETLVGDKPTQPVAPADPVKPENYIPLLEETPAKDKSEGVAEAPEGVEAPDADEKEAEEKEQPERNPESVKYDEDKKKFVDGRIDHEIALSKYKDELKAYEKKIEDGKAAVSELNERFGDWYYVMSADNLKTLQTTRKDLVTPKEIPEAQKTEGLPAFPDISFPEVPGSEAPASEASTEDPAAEMKTEPSGSDESTEVKESDMQAEQPESKNDAEPTTESSEEPPAKEKDPTKKDPKPESQPESETKAEPESVKGPADAKGSEDSKSKEKEK